jgi:hypothetical protein
MTVNGVKYAIGAASAAATFLAPWHDPPIGASAVDTLLAAGCALIATGVLGTFGAKR